MLDFFFRNIKISENATITSDGIVAINNTKKSASELKKEREILQKIYNIPIQKNVPKKLNQSSRSKK